MSSFTRLIADFAALTGVDADVDEYDSCTLETDGLVITVKYRRAHDDVVIFVPVTENDGFEPLKPEMLRTALRLSYNGAETRGNFLGLFENNLILSHTYGNADLTPEKLADILLAFAEAAAFVRNALKFSESAPEEASGSSWDSDLDAFTAGISV